MVGLVQYTFFLFYSLPTDKVALLQQVEFFSDPFSLDLSDFCTPLSFSVPTVPLYVHELVLNKFIFNIYLTVVM